VRTRVIFVDMEQWLLCLELQIVAELRKGFRDG
jgi:hypothetical protein